MTAAALGCVLLAIAITTAATNQAKGQTISIEWRWGEDKVDGLPGLAAELVSRKVDLLVTAGTPAAKALKSATGTIPIVMAIIGDPVAAGLPAARRRGTRRGLPRRPRRGARPGR